MRERKPHHALCPVTGKLRYLSRDSATHARRERQWFWLTAKPYRCRFCLGWHLTSQPARRNTMTTPTRVRVPVSEIQTGDRFDYSSTTWIALSNAKTHDDGTVTVRVRFQPDGGIGVREWDDPAMELNLTRPS